MSASDDNTTLTTDSAALAGELFAPGVGAQAGPPTTPASGTGTAGRGTTRTDAPTTGRLRRNQCIRIPA